MELLALLIIGLYLTVSLVAGGQMVLFGHRRRKAPESVIGWGLLLGGSLGYAPEALVFLGFAADDFVTPLRVLSQVGIRLSALLTLCFILLVFRRSSSWAWGLAIAVGLTLALTFFFAPTGLRSESSALRIVGDERSVLSSAGIFAYWIARTIVFFWLASEAMVSHRAFRRRLRARLIDPMVVNRLWLWSIAYGCAAVMCATPLLARPFGGSSDTAGWALFELALGLISTAALYLTFFPPELYRNLVKRRGEALAVD